MTRRGSTNPRGRGCEGEAGSLTIQSDSSTQGPDSADLISSAEKSGGRAGLIPTSFELWTFR